MPFWKRPVLPDSPEGALPVPDGAGPVAREALSAFNAGDFGRCRTLVRDLRVHATDAVDADVARDLTARLRPDPVMLGLAALSVPTLLFLALWAVTHSH